MNKAMLVGKLNKDPEPLSNGLVNSVAKIYDFTSELRLAAVRECGLALANIPDEFKTYELCLAAVQHYCEWVLDFIPEKFKTYELCLTAVLYDRDMLQVISLPKELETSEFYLAVVQHYGDVLMWVPEHLKTYELCLAAVKAADDCCRWGSPLQYVPEALKTPELCLTAVQQDGSAFQYVPEELNCLAAIQQFKRSKLRLVAASELLIDEDHLPF
jgi:hypothetical protein